MKYIMEQILHEHLKSCVFLWQYEKLQDKQRISHFRGRTEMGNHLLRRIIPPQREGFHTDCGYMIQQIVSSFADKEPGMQTADFPEIRKRCILPLRNRLIDCMFEEDLFLEPEIILDRVRALFKSTITR